MTDDTVIRVDGLWKRYGLPLPEFYYKGRRWLRSLRVKTDENPEDDEPWALQDVSFGVKRGETLGIIGRNGAGKSTLLKVLAGVTPPTRGKVDVNGRVFPMIELNAGMHMELTGRENVSLLGAIMGMSHAEIYTRIPAIEEFCDLKEWFDRPVRMYSSGMLARLGFAVAMNVNAEVLLIDEVLAVGDLAFQRKCFDRLERLRMGGVTALFVSHSTRQVERLCDRAILLDTGAVTQVGSAAAVINNYHAKSHNTHSGNKLETDVAKNGGVQGTGDLLVFECVLSNADGATSDRVREGDPLYIRLRYRAVHMIPEAIVGLAFIASDMLVISGFTNDEIHPRPNLVGEGWVGVKVHTVSLLPGIYGIRLKILHRNGAVLFSAEEVATFHVFPRHDGAPNLNAVGLVRTDVTWLDVPPEPCTNGVSI